MHAICTCVLNLIDPACSHRGGLGRLLIGLPLAARCFPSRLLCSLPGSSPRPRLARPRPANARIHLIFVSYHP